LNEPVLERSEEDRDLVEVEKDLYTVGCPAIVELER